MSDSIIKIKRTIYSGQLILPVAVLSAIAVLCAPSKVIAAFALLPVTVLLCVGPSHFAKIVFLMILITFPITLQYSGKDAFSVGTVFIFLTLAWAMTKRRITETITQDTFLFGILFMLVCIAFIGTVPSVFGGYWGPSVRHYLNFISSIVVFIVIVHLRHIPGTAHSERDYIEKIISALLLITVLHVFLSLLLVHFPWLGKYFTIFFHRTQEHLGSYFVGGVYTRATTIFASGEGFGELFVLLFPFSLYKFFVSKNKLSLFIVALLFLGTILSGTRSAFLLIAFQLPVFVCILVARKYAVKRFVVAVGSILICVAALSSFLNYSPVLTDRFQRTLDRVRVTAPEQKTPGAQDRKKSKVTDQVQSKVDIASIVNRQGVWNKAYYITKGTISLFGHGPIQAQKLGFQSKNFHCLYLSLLFQFGIIGTVFFILFFYTIAKRLLKSVRLTKDDNTKYLLAATCLLSLLCFLINEIKFEFNRSDSYQQLVWIFFAVFYLAGQLKRNSSNEKIDYHSSPSVRVP